MLQSISQVDLFERFGFTNFCKEEKKALEIFIPASLVIIGSDIIDIFHGLTNFSAEIDDVPPNLHTIIITKATMS